MFSKRFWKRRGISVLGPAFLALGSLAALSAGAEGAAIDILRPVGGLPPNIVGQMREPSAFVQTADGKYIIFDRRAQQVYGVNAAKTTLTRLVTIGPSDGQLLRPDVFAYNANRTFVVVDAPGEYERVQTFYEDGTPIGRFQRWPQRVGATRFTLNSVVFRGFGAVAAVGRSLFAGGQRDGELMSEVDIDGNVVRYIGKTRSTGHEHDALLHHALNTGIPLAAADGGLYFVFTTGVPMFRKYSPTGELLFERHIEGPELDGTIQTLPMTWPTRTAPDGSEFPAVASTVTTAAIDSSGHLWISLAAPFTYVYDTSGNKTRTIQFRGTELMVPTSFFFTKAGRLLVTPGCYEFAPGPP